MPLDPSEKERYSRHILLNGLTLSGVEKIRRGRVAVIGAGGLASPLLTYLTSSGIGQIVLVDPDRVTSTNLARQFLFSEGDVGKTKVSVAAEKLRLMNPGVEVKTIVEKANSDNFREIAAQCDVMVETVDSIAAKLMIHDLALSHRKPLIHGAALAWEGQLLTIFPGESPCLRCFFPNLSQFQAIPVAPSPNQFPWEEIGDSCSTEGVLSPLCGIIGSYQAAEVLGFFTRPQDELHSGKMLRIDLNRNRCYCLQPQTRNCSCGFTS